jgi:hypothetical protein
VVAEDEVTRAGAALRIAQRPTRWPLAVHPETVAPIEAIRPKA